MSDRADPINLSELEHLEHTKNEKNYLKSVRFACGG